MAYTGCNLILSVKDSADMINGSRQETLALAAVMQQLLSVFRRIKQQEMFI